MNKHAASHISFPAEKRFPPQDPQRAALLEQLHQSPQALDLPRSRWTLALIEDQLLPELTTLSGVCRRLQKWQIVPKQARYHISSPDPEYAAKRQAIKQAYEQMQAQPDQKRLLYADEVTFYRQAPLSPCYHEQGQSQPHAQWPGGYNTKYRIAASLDAWTGEVVPVLASKVSVDQLCRWLRAVREHYGPEVELTIAWDNWPIHKHAAVEAAAKEQVITLLYLPTYAPWTNPIEKLWRWLKQDLLRMHQYEDPQRWPKLREWVREFLERFARPSNDLLRYVGLSHENYAI